MVQSTKHRPRRDSSAVHQQKADRRKREGKRQRARRARELQRTGQLFDWRKKRSV